ncbi:high mobility group box domain-containing protein, partial [Crassisporium funariophilum]
KAKYEPDAPKRALSAYMFFSQDWRERIKIENPDACFGEVGKLLAVKWKELGDEGKKSYIEQAAKDKERYENEKSAYVRIVSPPYEPMSYSPIPTDRLEQRKRRYRRGLRVIPPNANLFFAFFSILFSTCSTF